MKIGYRTQGAGLYTTLADDSAGDLIVGFKPRLAGVPQAEALFRASTIFLAARGNRQWQLAGTVTKAHASADAAAAFLQSQAAALADFLDLQLTQGATVIYYTPVVFTGFEPALQGASSVITYTFLCGTLTTVAP